ncbi:helix-turn-helix domain-containing protein [Streptacidiphilus carbonis]|uniref:helix-turn-helix domain-containing protein n=1 Tax=Streptacidiphilus carbonis TaxID=105422 RepID=UPI001F445C68|nr:helix-turn-helix transcriptional regulator [Streptacidiphilus carbonis]
MHADLPTPAQRRALREAAGLSQAEVARIVGVTTAAVGHWETGVRQTPRNPTVFERYVQVLRALREAI